MKAWGIAVVCIGLAACGGAIAPEDGPPASTSKTSAPPAPPPPPPPGAPRPTGSASPSAPVLDSPILACGDYDRDVGDVLSRFAAVGRAGVFRVARVDEECSGLGGAHVTLAFEEGCRDPGGPIHVGGHGCSEKWNVGDLVVAAFDDTAVAPRADWCLDAMPTSVGTARAFVLVSSRDDGVKLLAKAGCAP